MATQRYISTSFWDDVWIRSINSMDRYLYLYLMTNPLTNIAGVYQISVDRIAFDTGIDERTLLPMLKRFADKGKAIHYKDEWMILPKWPAHQRWEWRSKIKQGIESILRKLDPNLLGFLVQCGYTYPIDTLSIPYTYESSYLDTDTDLDSDTDTDTESRAIARPSAKRPSAMKDELADFYQSGFVSRQPDSTWSDYKKERQALVTLAKKTRNLLPDVGVGDELSLAGLMLATFFDAKQTGKGEYWRDCPFIPSMLLNRWADVSSRLQQKADVHNQMRDGLDAIARMKEGT